MLTRSHSYILCSVRPWAYFEHILDLLTANHCDHGENGNGYLLSIIKLIAMPRNNFLAELYTKLIFQGQKGVLEMSIRGHQDVFEVSKDIGFSKFKTKIPSFQISPPIIEQFGQFVLSVKNRKKLDAEKLSKLELQVAT